MQFQSAQVRRVFGEACVVACVVLILNEMDVVAIPGVIRVVCAFILAFLAIGALLSTP